VHEGKNGHVARLALLGPYLIEVPPRLIRSVCLEVNCLVLDDGQDGIERLGIARLPILQRGRLVGSREVSGSLGVRVIDRTNLITFVHVLADLVYVLRVDVEGGSRVSLHCVRGGVAFLV
jgi:hypothetical protein